MAFGRAAFALGAVLAFAAGQDIRAAGLGDCGSMKAAPVVVADGRSLYLGSVETGAIVHTGGDTTAAEVPSVNDIHVHEFCFSLRCDIG